MAINPNSPLKKPDGLQRGTIKSLRDFARIGETASKPTLSLLERMSNFEAGKQKKWQNIIDHYKSPLDIPTTQMLIPKVSDFSTTYFSDEHKTFFDELEENPTCIKHALTDLQKYKESNPDFVEIIGLSVEIANRRFLYEIDNRGPKQDDSPNYNYFINLLFQDENQKYISVAFNIDYSAGYFRDENFFFFDKTAKRQKTTYGIQFLGKVDEYSSQEKPLVEYRNHKLESTRLNKPIIEYLENKPILTSCIRGKERLTQNGCIVGFEFKLSLYLEDTDQPIKLDKDDKPLVNTFELKLDDELSTLFVNNRMVRFQKKRTQQYKLLKYIFTDKLKTDYLNPKMIITFLKTEKVIDNMAYDTENLRDTINRLNTKIKNDSDLKDNFLIFDGGKITINKTIKLI